jgi:hypothetical protein
VLFWYQVLQIPGVSWYQFFYFKIWIGFLFLFFNSIFWYQCGINSLLAENWQHQYPSGM